MLPVGLWRKLPGKYFCISTKKGDDWEDVFFKRTELGKVAAFIQSRSDHNVYFCPHGFTRPKRRKEFAVPAPILWADLDTADPETLAYRPTIAWRSSDRRYASIWILDNLIEGVEGLNQRMSYAIGADRSGWDFTQVLRVPGTMNYKYNPPNRVRLMWRDGPTYRAKDLESRLPSINGHEGPVTDVAAIFRKYEKAIPPWARKELINGRPSPGKRSEMVWKLGAVLMESGLSEDEAFLLLKASPWNKFKGRNDEDKQLRRQLDKALDQKFNTVVSASSGSAPDLLCTPMSDVVEEKLDWIWYPYLARGELTIIEGDPGVGKSYLAQMIGRHICDGIPLPQADQRHPDKKTQGLVVYFDIENTAGSVTKKRLRWNGLKNMDKFFQEETFFTIDNPEMMEKVYEALEKRKPTFVVFDTLNTYIGKADIYRSNEAQAAMNEFREIGRRFNCAVVVLRHLTKGSRDKAIYRGQGSISLAGLARVVIAVGTNPEDPDENVMAITKLNIAKRPRALAFSIRDGEATLQDPDVSKFEWHGFVDMDVEDILSHVEEERAKEERKERSKAGEFLEQFLAKGGQDIEDIKIAAEAKAISLRSLYYSAKKLGIKKERSGFGAKQTSVWSLPEDNKEGPRAGKPEAPRRSEEEKRFGKVNRSASKVNSRRGSSN